MVPSLEEVLVGEQQLVDLMQEQVDWVQRCLETPHDDWTPQLAVIVKQLPDIAEPKLHLCSLAVNFNEAFEKRHTLESLGRHFYGDETIPVAAVLSSEAWSAPDTPGVEPRHNPLRKEVIQFIGSTLDGKHTAWTHIPVTRAGTSIVLGEPIEIVTKGVRAPILGHFFRGFLGAVRR